MNAREKEKQSAVRELREILKPGDTVYTKLDHVSRSGMSRVITPFIIRDNEPCLLSWLVEKALDYSPHRKYTGVQVSGCGMDMGFHLVYALSRVLFPDGFEILQSDDNGVLRPVFESDGGCALKQQWL